MVLTQPGGSTGGGRRRHSSPAERHCQAPDASGPAPPVAVGDEVSHRRRGRGVVQAVQGGTVVVHFQGAPAPRRYAGAAFADGTFAPAAASPHGRPQTATAGSAVKPQDTVLADMRRRRAERRELLQTLQLRLDSLLAAAQSADAAGSRGTGGPPPAAPCSPLPPPALRAPPSAPPDGAHYHNEMTVGYGFASVERQVRLFIAEGGARMDFWIHSTHWWCVPDVPFEVLKRKPGERGAVMQFDPKLMRGMEGTVVTQIRAWYDADSDSCPIEVVVWTSWMTPDMVVPCVLLRKPAPGSGWAGSNGEIVWGVQAAPPRVRAALP
eukprot:TRINITY_DN12203_c0_g1_i1.p1 TRINITY_DN12203_c0_g1~~TRINITY_DN12203_c0_g1_i1.p1  ORF type:complete len:345 (+),score=91.32 TRINITY_DN12203_c0_g1_i1:68-1036(+)